jgi:hypothetical protein
MKLSELDKAIERYNEVIELLKGTEKQSELLGL